MVSVKESHKLNFSGVDTIERERLELCEFGNTKDGLKICAIHWNIEDLGVVRV